MDLGNLAEVLITAASKGGTSAVMVLLFLMGAGAFFAGKYILKDKEKQLTEAKAQLAQKEQDLKDRTQKFEDVIQKYHSGTMTMAEAFQKVETLLHEIKGMISGTGRR